MLLEPYRVLDLTEDGGALCAQILADLGADVIQIEPPGGARGRRLGPFVEGSEDVEHSLRWWAYSRGKRSVELDLVAEAETFRNLVAQADFLIEAFPVAQRSTFGVEHATLARINPKLIHVSITPYGSTGPKAHWLASDLTLIASGGPMAITGDEDRAPLRVSVPQAWEHAAAEAAAGAMIALHGRTQTGLGQLVEVSVQQAVTLATQGNSLATAVGETTAQRIAGGIKSGDVRIQLTYPALDGHVSITHIFGATVGPATRRLMEYVFDEGFCDAATRDKDWIEYGLLLSTGAEPIAEFERVKDCVAACTRSKTKAELLQVAMDRRLLLAPMTTVADVVHSEQFQKRDVFLSFAAAPFQKAAFPGPFAKFSHSPLRLNRQPPRLGEHTAEVLGALPPSTTEVQSQVQSEALPEALPNKRLPLHGVKILDFMWALAGPGATRLLADFGATVIRVESSHRLDVCRTIRPFMQGDPAPDKSAVFHSTNAGKRLISLDLTKPESREVILDLVRWADVVTESFSPRAMKTFGFDYHSLQAIKPDLIMLSTCLMGQTGPLAMFAGYGNLAAAIAGFYAITGWPDREPAGPFGAYTDYIAPRYNAIAVLAALEYRRRTGQGQHIDLAQAEAAMHFLTPAILDYSVNGHVPTRMGNRDVNWAPHGVYPTAGDDTYLAIVCESDEQWACFTRAFPDADLPEKFRQSRVRLVEQDELDTLITALTLKVSAAELEQRLQSAGVPTAQVQNSPELLADPQLQHLGHFVELPHHEGGHTVVESPRLRLSQAEPVVDTSAPTFGRDMMFVLQEVLGYDDERVSELLVAGVLE